tara:strand:- start:41878 stop:42729 length:852 start_codon:yes stop_codon:yes gene_type:complete
MEFVSYCEEIILGVQVLLTNCHTLILREVLKETSQAHDSDVYVYNIVPDSLPLSEEFNAKETHKFQLPKGAYEKYPKLKWVKCHLIVDNYCHYGSINKPLELLSPKEKKGYTYQKGKELIPFLEDFCFKFDIDLDPSTKFYVSHILTEISVDYSIYLEDESVANLLNASRDAMETDQINEFCDGLAVLYDCEPEKIFRARSAPRKFYGDLHDLKSLFLDGRAKIILRKLGIEFSEENIMMGSKLIESCSQITKNFEEFTENAKKAILAHENLWDNGDPVISES